MSAANPLDALRREIDRIDDTIHDLIQQRTEIVEKVRDLKRSERVKIRPARSRLAWTRSRLLWPMGLVRSRTFPD